MSLRVIDGGAKPPEPEEIDGSIRPFRDYAEVYYANGWIPLPLPPRAKSSPPSRTTGRYDPPKWKDIKEMLSSAHEFSNIAIRMPLFAFGNDVDDYGDKNGASTMLLVEEESGLILPETYSSSARTDGASGIRYYRLPDSRVGTHLPGKLGPGVEVIQHRHRYAVAPPSIHPDFERHYKWYAPNQPLDGNGTFDVPRAKKVALV